MSENEKPLADSELIRLLGKMAAGDEHALEALYDATSRRLYGLVFSILREPALAEEVSLDIYLEIWRRAGEYQPVRGTPWAWLSVLARCRAIDRLRTWRTQQAHQVDEFPIHDFALEDALPEDIASDDERGRCVRQALLRLSAEQRQVLALSYYRGLSHHEIAVLLSLPVGTVKTRMRSGMHRLQAILRPQLAGKTV